MDMKIGNQTIGGVKLVELAVEGRRLKHETPENRRAFDEDSFMLTDGAGAFYLAHKAGLLDQDLVDVDLRRCRKVEIGGRSLAFRYANDLPDSPREKAAVARSDRWQYVKEVFTAAWWVVTAIPSLLLGLG